MRACSVLILGLVLAVSVRSAAESPPPSEIQIEARIKALQQQQADLKAKEDQLRKELAEAKQRAFGGIKAEVTGILKKHDFGHYIMMRLAKGEEQRVWLKPSDPALYQQMAKLLDKEVAASGSLQQTGKASSLPLVPIPGTAFSPPPPVAPPALIPPTNVPDFSMYLEQFTIAEFIQKK